MSIRIQMEGPVYNTRDLGGIPAGNGYVIRSRCLLRSGALGKCSEGDVRKLTKDYGLRTVVDLRTEAEKAEVPDPGIEGVKFYHNPIMSNAMLGITREGQSQVSSLMDMIMGFMKEAGENPGEKLGLIYPVMVTEDFCVRQLSAFFDILLEQEDGSILWHCTAGKDRVGTTTALLLTALGVEREEIIRDYLLTNTCLRPETEAMVAAVARKIQDENILQAVRILNGADRSYIEAMFAETEKQCGSTEAFLEKRLGLTKEKTAALREKFLEKTSC